MGYAMASMVFDTLAHAKKLKEAGFTEKQAEVQAEALASIIDEKLATKEDIRLLKEDLKALEERLTYKLTLRLGSMLVVAITVLAILMKL